MSTDIEAIAKAWMAHQGYTADDIEVAETDTHQKRGCDWHGSPGTASMSTAIRTIRPGMSSKRPPKWRESQSKHSKQLTSSCRSR